MTSSSLDTLSSWERGLLAGVGSSTSTLGDLPLFHSKTSSQLNGLNLFSKPSIKSLSYLFGGWRFAVPSWGAIGFAETWTEHKAIQKIAPNGNPSEVQQIYSCCIGGAVAAPAVCVVESILTQVLIEFGKGKASTEIRVKDVMKNMYRQHGFASFTRGTLPTIFRDMPYTYGYLKGDQLIMPWVKKYVTNEDYAQACSGLWSGVGNAIISQPADVVKTAMQGDMEQKKYTTFSRTCVVIFQDKGWRGFFEGLTSRVGRVSFAIFYLSVFMHQSAKLMEKNARSSNT